MTESIRVSPKHGVNPSLIACYACGGDAGVALLGRLPNDAEAPRRATFRHVFCDRCEAVIDGGGVLLIEVRDGEPHTDDPYRTGRMWGITGEAFDRLYPRRAPGHRRPPAAFIEEAVACKAGFPHDDPKEGATP